MKNIGLIYHLFELHIFQTRCTVINIVIYQPSLKWYFFQIFIKNNYGLKMILCWNNKLKILKLYLFQNTLNVMVIFVKITLYWKLDQHNIKKKTILFELIQYYCFTHKGQEIVLHTKEMKLVFINDLHKIHIFDLSLPLIKLVKFIIFIVKIILVSNSRLYLQWNFI